MDGTSRFDLELTMTWDLGIEEFGLKCCLERMYRGGTRKSWEIFFPAIAFQ
jgi:hypothetical protein